MTNRKSFTNWLALILLTSQGLAFAENQTITLRADNARFNQHEGTGVYEGNAELEQGLRLLLADRIYIYTLNGELTRVEAEGAPLSLKEGETLNARADHLDYDVGANHITLRGNAQITHLGRTFEGARILYNLETEEMEASGDGTSRIKMTIPGETQGRQQDGAKNDDQ